MTNAKPYRIRGLLGSYGVRRRMGKSVAAFPKTHERNEEDAVRALLRAHGLTHSPADHVDALIWTVRKSKFAKRRPSRGLATRERQKAITCVRALLRHGEVRPRRQESTDTRRRALISLIDSMPAMVKLAAASSFNAVPVLERLRENTYTPGDLRSLLSALEDVRPGTGAAPPNAPFLPLLRAGVMVWEVCGRRERYTYNEYVDPPAIEGPLPDFLHALMDLAGMQRPSSTVLQRHLRSVKNL